MSDHRHLRAVQWLTI